MSSKWEAEHSRKADPLRPLIGFLLLVVLAGLSILTAKPLANWLQTARLNFGALGWQILPITFPDWPDLAKHGLVAAVTFLIVFALIMIVLMAVMRPPRGEMDVRTSKLRAEKARQRRRR